jgi:2-C-methyl-D-erythritol 4-phosphate cytidylyltransferase
MNRDAVIIVAGGEGRRLGGEVPKQFLPLGDAPVLWHTLRAFHDYDPSLQIIVVLHPSWTGHWEKISSALQPAIDYEITTGGRTRFHSVRNGLARVRGDGLTAVHDASRPLVSRELLERTFTTAREKGNAIPAIPVTDSLREITAEGNRPVDRSRYRSIQTPQIFPTQLLKEAFRQPYEESFTDEATVVERTGENIYLAEGEKMNIKITTAFDLQVAELLLGKDKR